MTDGVIDGFSRKLQHCSDTGGSRRAEVSYVVNLVLVQADSLHEVDLNFVTGCNTANKVCA